VACDRCPVYFIPDVKISFFALAAMRKNSCTLVLQCTCISHRVCGIRLLQKCRPVCEYYEKYQMYDGVNIKWGKKPMVTG